MKYFHKFTEDLDQRRQQLKQRQQERHDDFKNKTLGAQQDSQQAAKDREDMKNEIKKELRSGK